MTSRIPCYAASSQQHGCFEVCRIAWASVTSSLYVIHGPPPISAVDPAVFHGVSLVLTELGPDVGEGRVPEAHVELVVGGEKHGLVQRRAGRRLGRDQRQEGAAVVGVRQHQGLHAGEVAGRGELAQVGVVEGLEVQQAVQPRGRQAREQVVAQVPARDRKERTF